MSTKEPTMSIDTTTALTAAKRAWDTYQVDGAMDWDRYANAVLDTLADPELNIEVYTEFTA